MKDKNIQDLINFYNSGKLTIVKKKVVELIKKYPNNFILHNIFGAVLADQENLDEAIINYRKSIKINPDYAEVHNNLGGAFYKLKKYDESIDSYQRAIQIKPNFAQAHNNLGIVFKELGKFNKSIDSYQRAIQIKPNYAEAYKNFGNVLVRVNKIDEAISNYEKAIKINASTTETLKKVGNFLKQSGKIDEARKCFNKLFKLKPNDVGYKINSEQLIAPLVQSVKEIDFFRDEYVKSLETLKKYKYLTEKPADIIGVNFFNLAYHAKDNLEIMVKTAKLFKQIIPSINYASKNINKPKKQKKIKVGFISEFLTRHTIGKLFGGLIKNIDRKKFYVIIFHTSKTEGSQIKNKIDNSANKIVNLSNNIKEQQQQVEEENLDIVFYPDIGMSSTTYFLAFSRFAPVQIVSWGHPETTGINTIDYFLSSKLFETVNTGKKYSERLICLNQFPLYYEPPENLGVIKNRIELRLPEKTRLYGCPQSLFKLHPDFDIILSQILYQDPEANIILIGGEGVEKFWIESLKKRWLKNFPILNKKVLFTKRLPLLDFVSLCNCVEVLLDPLHFGGGNSFLESMLTGTPTITMPSTHLKSNITAAAYRQMKISNPPIVKNSKEYVDLAIKLAKDNNKNQSLREESKIAANKYLYKNLNSLKEFEKFLEEAYQTSQTGDKLKDGYVFKS